MHSFKERTRQCSTLSLNSLLNCSFLIPNEKVNIDKKEGTLRKENKLELEDTRVNTSPQGKQVSFEKKFVTIINVCSYKNYNKLPQVSNTTSIHKKRSIYYKGEKNSICKCFIY